MMELHEPVIPHLPTPRVNLLYLPTGCMPHDSTSLHAYTSTIPLFMIHES